jgi:hypothetical protein
VRVRSGLVAQAPADEPVSVGRYWWTWLAGAKSTGVVDEGITT